MEIKENQNLISREENDFLPLLNGIEAIDRIARENLPVPFETEIFLYGTEIAGTSHVPDIDKLANELEQGDRLILLREPDNPYDEHAIVIKTLSGNKLGYIPRMNNLILSRLMDAGKELYGITRLKEKNNGYWKIVVKVYMKE